MFIFIITYYHIGTSKKHYFSYGIIKNYVNKETVMLKDLITIGLGGALLAKEKVEQELSDLVDKGKMNKEEAQSFIDKAKVKGEEMEKPVGKSIIRFITETRSSPQRAINPPSPATQRCSGSPIKNRRII